MEIVDSDLYLVGSTMGTLGEASAGDADIFVAQYDDSGSAKQIQQFGTSEYDQAR